MEFNAKKGYVLEMGRSGYKLGQNIISIEKEEKDLEVVIQDNLSLKNILIKYLVTHLIALLLH